MRKYMNVTIIGSGPFIIYSAYELSKNQTLMAMQDKHIKQMAIVSLKHKIVGQGKPKQDNQCLRTIYLGNASGVFVDSEIIDSLKNKTIDHK